MITTLSIVFTIAAGTLSSGEKICTIKSDQGGVSWIHRLEIYRLLWPRAVLFSILNRWDHWHFILDGIWLFARFSWYENFRLR
jgi:hypothetical protein